MCINKLSGTEADNVLYTFYAHGMASLWQVMDAFIIFMMVLPKIIVTAVLQYRTLHHYTVVISRLVF
jgi:hypothetical protein